MLELTIAPSNADGSSATASSIASNVIIKAARWRVVIAIHFIVDVQAQPKITNILYRINLNSDADCSDTRCKTRLAIIGAKAPSICIVYLRMVAYVKTGCDL